MSNQSKYKNFWLRIELKAGYVLSYISTEFWEDHFSCRYPGSPTTPFNMNFTRNCSGNEKLTAENTEFEGQLQFVSDAVIAFAHAFR